MDSVSTTTMPRKFGFDADFKAESQENAQADQQKTLTAAIAAEVAAGNLFDAQALNNAVQQAEQKAFQAGVASATESQNQQLVVLWQQALEKTEQLLSADNARDLTAQKMALTSTLLAIKKAFPALADKVADAQIAAVLQEVFEHQNQEARLVVRVADAVLDTVIQQVEQLKQQHAFMGKVVVLAESSLGLGDCRVEWADGGLEYLQKNIQRGLEEAIIRVMQTTTQQTEISTTLSDNNEV